MVSLRTSPELPATVVVVCILVRLCVYRSITQWNCEMLCLLITATSHTPAHNSFFMTLQTCVHVQYMNTTCYACLQVQHYMFYISTCTTLHALHTLHALCLNMPCIITHLTTVHVHHYMFNSSNVQSYMLYIPWPVYLYMYTCMLHVHVLP